MPGDVLTFAVVIAHAKMLLEILLGILEVVLGFRREHESAKICLAELF
jgi:hypothetical protein